jgi:hypothetical protein
LFLTILHIFKLLLNDIEIIIRKNLCCFKQTSSILHSWLYKLL